MKYSLIVLVLMLFSIQTFAGDILILKNRRIFDGKVLKIKDCQILFAVRSNRYIIPAGDVEQIRFEDITSSKAKKYLKSSKLTNCLKGRLDAARFHGKSVGHFALGFFFGGFSMIGTMIASPTPDKGKSTYLKSQNEELFYDPEYISCYKKRARGKLIGWEAAGWSVAILTFLSSFDL